MNHTVLPSDHKAESIIIRLETKADGPSIETLITDAFGPGRLAKTAERLREANHAIPALSFVVESQAALLATLRLWPIQAVTKDAAGQAQLIEGLAFLGPIAVKDTARGLGLGQALVTKAIEAAKTYNINAIILVGPLSYFSRFGFEPAYDAKTKTGLLMPGPFDPKRLLSLRFNDNTILSGQLGVARPQ